VDCDVHAGINTIQDLMPYLPEVWQIYVRESGFKQCPPLGIEVKPNAPAARASPSGRLPGSDLAFFKPASRLLEIERAIVNPLYAADYLPNVRFRRGLCSAHNDYMIENWYEKDERLYGSFWCRL